MQKKKLITHNGNFHSDDIFACATFSLVLERAKESFEVVRTRDEELIKKGDYVFDVGSVYNPEQNRFDHHQPGGAGKRPNGVEYSSFGLLWKKFGEELSGSRQAAALVDRKLVSPIDAADNGLNLVESIHEVKPYFIQHAFKAFRPSWKETNEEKILEAFLLCVDSAREILLREIKIAKDTLEALAIVQKIY